MISGASRSYITRIVGVGVVCDVSGVGGGRMVRLMGGSVVFGALEHILLPLFPSCIQI